MPLITITGPLGSAKTDIARRVADRLNVTLFDDQRLHQEAVRMALRPQELKSLDEKAPGFFDRLYSVRSHAYVDLLESVVYSVARDGEGVIVGHGSPFLLRDFGCAFHVLVHAPMKSRVEHIMKRMGLNRKDAAALVQKSTDQQQGFMRFAFHVEMDAPALYDLVINREKLGVQFAADMVLAAVEPEGVKACGLRSTETMERLSLANRVKAELRAERIDLSTLVVEVPEAGVVRLRGWLKTQGSGTRAVEAVRRVPGVREVQADIAAGLYSPKKVGAGEA